MKTSYEEVYDSFINKIKDYDFLNLGEEEVESLCFKYLKSSIPFVKPANDKFIERDDMFKQFNEKLTVNEIEILSNLMVVQWTTPQIYSITNMKQFLGDKEYKFFSQANHLGMLSSLRKEAVEVADGLMINNSYTLDALNELNADD